LAPWIISHFPAHKSYVEPCGGAANVLLQKARSELETYNDVDNNVVNFFSVLRDNPQELIEKIWLTPWARREYETAYDPHDCPVERARRFYTACWMSITPTINNAWRPNRRNVRFLLNSDKSSIPQLNAHEVDHLYAIAERLLRVQIENDPYVDVIKRYDTPGTLIYFDPPYVTDKRTEGNVYMIEWGNADHADAAELLRQCAGHVVISGYACPLYTELYEAYGWHRVDKEAQTNSGGKRIESLWLSPRTWAALQDNHDDLPMFAGEVAL
jgi:DNA adenine methylase